MAREKMLEKLKENLAVALNRMKQQADRNRSDRTFEVGDWVFLKLQAYRHMSIERRKTTKLSPRYFGPYEIVARVGSVAYTLKLPEGSRVHPTFHVSLLKRCSDPSIVPVHLPEDFGVSSGIKEPSLLDRRIVQKRGRAVTEVLVRWLGETAEDATWELWQDVQRKYPEFSRTSHPWGQG